MAAKGGAPTKFTPEVRAKIIKALATGNDRTTACAVADISARCLINWMNRGRRPRPNNKEDKPFVQFLHDVKKAEEKAVAIAVRNIRVQGRKQWTAFAWWLERKFPERWGDQKKLVAELKQQLEQMGKIIDGLAPKAAEASKEETAPARRTGKRRGK